MIKRSHELKVDRHKDFFEGKGVLTNIHFIDKEDAKGKGRLFAKGSLGIGSSVGHHVHSGDFETYYILSGKALVTDNDGSKHILEKGDVMTTKSGQSHSIENCGDTDLEFIAVILFD